jgi:predicted glycoside hydrolase/deacetylase ChbG (UPF0249 family)
MLTGRLRIEEVVIELRAQIEKALRAGLRLTHVDSHKHTHALPQICEAIVATMKDYGINAVRAPRERWRFDRDARSFTLIIQSAGADRSDRRIARRRERVDVPPRLQ